MAESKQPDAPTGAPAGRPASASAGGPVGAPASPRADSKNMLPPRERRRSPLERVFVRIIATCGIVAIGVAIGAIMTSSNSAGWLIGLVVAAVSVVLAAVLWSSRQL
jgi:protein-S-isoprenylcysteine O-methyltransferase Ste14